MAATALIIEDDADYGVLLARHMKTQGFNPVVVDSGEEGLDRLADLRPELVLVDIGLPGIDGIEVTKTITEREPSTVCIIVSGRSSLDMAVAAMKAGAFDFISKTTDVEEIRFRLDKALETANLRQEIQYLRQSTAGLSELIGSSPAMQNVGHLIELVAATPNSTVLISGETGTGKELCARAIHKLSSRSNKPLVSVNCAAVPESLLESEFFGHERGAFTGADRLRRGPFETANGGSLFLDEIGELDLKLQAKLLRVLEERKLKRVGGEKDVEVDVRLIVATNRDIGKMVEERVFREDLLYRINVFSIDLPPLRERGDDIVLLAQHFIVQLNRELGKKVRGLSREAERVLSSYDFPGNVRQLRNLVEQAMILAQSDTLTHDLIRGLGTAPSTNPPAQASPLPAHVDDVSIDELMEIVQAKGEDLLTLERVLVSRALSETKHNKTKAAALLGMTRYAFHRRLKRLELVDE